MCLMYTALKDCHRCTYSARACKAHFVTLNWSTECLPGSFERRFSRTLDALPQGTTRFHASETFVHKEYVSTWTIMWILCTYRSYPGLPSWPFLCIPHLANAQQSRHSRTTAEADPTLRRRSVVPFTLDQFNDIVRQKLHVSAWNSGGVAAASSTYIVAENPRSLTTATF